MIGMKLEGLEKHCDSPGETCRGKTKKTSNEEIMREFIVLDNQDFQRILRYLVLVVTAMALSTILLRFSKDGKRRQAQEISRLNPFYSTRLKPIDNFFDFPCFPHLISSQTLKWNGKCVRTINNGAINFGIKLDERCQFLPINKTARICTYKPLGENESLFINEEGRRNKKYIDIMLKMFEINRKLYFFDVSIGDGEYCIAAAAHSNKTICMNGNYKTVIMLLKSVIMNRNPGNIRFIWNVLRDKHEVVTQKLYSLKPNEPSYDDSFNTFSSLSSNIDEIYDVNSVTLDDLTGLFQKKPVFMKLDLDSTDASVFLSSDRFFRLVNLRVLQVVTKDKDKAIRTADRLGYHGFLPYSDPFQRRHLKRKEKWPRNVYFMK